MRLDALLASQPLAVLATESGGHPYTNLVAYAAEGPAGVFFATTRATRKWSHLVANPRVSVLVDDRTNREVDFHEAAAATGMGVANVCVGGLREHGLALLEGRHPHLTDFLRSPSTDIFLVHMTDWYVVERFQAVSHLSVGWDGKTDEVTESTS